MALHSGVDHSNQFRSEQAGRMPRCLEEAHKLLFLHEDPLRKNAGNPDTTTAKIILERSQDYCALKEPVEKKSPFFKAPLPDII